MRALIILNSELPPESRYRQALDNADMVICADGGANRALEAGIQPHYVVGDLDSISPETRKQLAEARIIYTPRQDAPDVEKTLQFAREHGVQSAVLLGVTAGRFDHQICNLNIMEKFSSAMHLRCIDTWGVGEFVRGWLRFEAPVGQQVSLFAFRKAGGITTTGLKYPLINAEMEWAVNDGLSNEVVSSPVEIRIEEGTLFVYRVWPDA